MLRETMPVARAFSATLSFAAFACMLLKLDLSSVEINHGNVPGAEDAYLRAVGLGLLGMIAGGTSVYINRYLVEEKEKW